MTKGPYTSKKHVWVKPPPGQGSGRICKNCGGRLYLLGEDSECGTVAGDEVALYTEHDYDPYEE